MYEFLKKGLHDKDDYFFMAYRDKISICTNSLKRTTR